MNGGNVDRDALRAWLDLLAAAGALKKSIDAKLRDGFGLSISRFDVLAALDRAGAGGLRAGALSARLKVTEGNTTQVTAPLIRAGLVRRAASDKDGRVAIFRLTAKGRRLFAEVADTHRRWVAEAFSGLDADEVAAFRTLLGKLERDALAAGARKDAA
ncbi:MAG: MarR family transcriptional regulator [Pseudomonadota bacterium]|nr:MarR family transcriptional regulator [Pseudomonadota bacterium]